MNCHVRSPSVGKLIESKCDHLESEKFYCFCVSLSSLLFFARDRKRSSFSSGDTRVWATRITVYFGRIARLVLPWDEKARRGILTGRALMIAVRWMKWRFIGTVMAVEEFRIIIRVLIMCSLKTTDQSNVKKEFSLSDVYHCDRLHCRRNVAVETFHLLNCCVVEDGCSTFEKDTNVDRSLAELLSVGEVFHSNVLFSSRERRRRNFFHRSNEKWKRFLFCTANRRTERNKTCLYRRRFQVDCHFSLMLENLSYLRTCNLARWFHLAVLDVWCLKMTWTVLSFPFFVTLFTGNCSHVEIVADGLLQIVIDRSLLESGIEELTQIFG